ncbi:P-loop containing nucleoside triphosphate hydrolase protein [Hypoxylon sp. FL1284]|nr:P-loop containing nucleoside triphosphate hydrolase protein [Hypoxylon sp. FL1284]
MLEAVTKEMPRFEEYLGCFPSHERLRLRLVDVYQVFITFCARALKFLKKNKLILGANMVVRSIHSSFESSLIALRESTARLEQEARAANIKEGFDREQAAKRRHQEVMRRLTIVPVTTVERQIIDIPYQPHDRFLGRQTELRKLHSFLDPTPVMEHSLRVLVIRGLGGSGKTQLALKYTAESRESRDDAYKIIFWFRAEDPTILQQDFAKLGRILDPDSSTSPGQLKSVQIAKDFLSTTTKRYLVVFDNVDNVDHIREFWPNSGTGSILVTTRDRDVADALSSTQIELRGFETDEGLSLLNSHIGPLVTNLSGDAKIVAREIVNELGGLPLAICQMGSYIRQTNCRLDELLENLQSRARSSRLYSDSPSAKILPYSNTLAACCDLSINLLSPEEKHLLGVIAFFQTDEMEEILIIEGSRAVPDLHDMSQKMDWNDMIRNLARHGLVTRYQKPAGSTLFMHRVIKCHTLGLLDAGDEASHSRAFRNAVGLLHQMFPSRPPNGGIMIKQLAECERWLPHVLSLRNALASSGRQLSSLPGVYADLLLSCCRYLCSSGPKHVQDFFMDAFNTWETMLGPESTDSFLSDIFIFFAVTQQMIQVSQCSEIWPSIFDHATIEFTFSSSYLDSLSRHVTAKDMFMESMQIKGPVLGEQMSPYMHSIFIYNASRVEEALGLLPEALGKAKRALVLAEAEKGPDDFRINQFRFTYADLLVATGNPEAGLAIHKDTLADRKRVMGEEHNDTATSYYGLSVAHQRLKNTEKAMDSINLAISIFSKISGSQDRLARSYYRKYLILLDAGDATAAEVALATAQKLLAALTGRDDQSALSIAHYDSLVAYYNR